MNGRLLNYEKSGAGKPLIILHGLFGSLKNWRNAAKSLSGRAYEIFSVDLRNHGDSFHSDDHSIDLMVNDIRELVVNLGLERVSILGHSMGGLVAMKYASVYGPVEVESLIVVDIAPRNYDYNFSSEFEALNLNIANMKKRSDIDLAMSKTISDIGLRNFLLMNVAQFDGKYSWKLNVPVLEKFRRNMHLEIGALHFDGPALFIYGEQSAYFVHDDIGLVKGMFPKANIEIIARAGHWLHYTHQENFTDIVDNFLSNV